MIGAIIWRENTSISSPRYPGFLWKRGFSITDCWMNSQSWRSGPDTIPNVSKAACDCSMRARFRQVSAPGSCKMLTLPSTSSGPRLRKKNRKMAMRRRRQAAQSLPRRRSHPSPVRPQLFPGQQLPLAAMRWSHHITRKIERPLNAALPAFASSRFMSTILWSPMALLNPGLTTNRCGISDSTPRMTISALRRADWARCWRCPRTTMEFGLAGCRQLAGARPRYEMR